MNINLRKLMYDRKLDRNHVAQVLFPTNKHPNVALTRLLAGRSKLVEDQIFRLAMFTGLTTDQLYQESLHWKHTAQNGLVRFTMDEYAAIYSPATGITKIYHLESLLATHTISKTNQPLQEYLTEINQIVINKQVKQ